MSAIEPGTQVRVVIDGIVEGPISTHRFWLDSGPVMYGIEQTDPAVQVIPFDPERPTLDREAIARAMWEAARDKPNSAHWEKGHEYIKDSYRRRADATLALIQAAHPEWTP